MPLVNAKCENCGAILVINKENSVAICKYCGSAFVVEKAIENYNFTTNYNLTYNITNNISAKNVYVSGKGDADKERLMKNAETDLRLGEYERATELYRQIIMDYPDDYRGWLGLSCALSKGFQDEKISAEMFSQAKSGIEKMGFLCPSENQTKAAARKKWQEYCESRSQYMEKVKEDLSTLSSKEILTLKAEHSCSQSIDYYTEQLESCGVMLQKSVAFLQKKSLCLIPFGVTFYYLGSIFNTNTIFLGIFILALIPLLLILRGLSYLSTVNKRNNYRKLLKEENEKLEKCRIEKEELQGLIANLRKTYEI